MGCMGPDMDYVAPMADRMTKTIVSVLAEHGYTKPKPGPLTKLNRFPQKWDAEVEKIRGALHELLEIEACDKF